MPKQKTGRPRIPKAERARHVQAALTQKDIDEARQFDPPLYAPFRSDAQRYGYLVRLGLAIGRTARRANVSVADFMRGMEEGE